MAIRGRWISSSRSRFRCRSDTLSTRCAEIAMKISFSVLIGAALLVVGCASEKQRDDATTRASSASRDALFASAASKLHAECLVCKKNADLACVDIAVDNHTPSYVFAGTTYY